MPKIDIDALEVRSGSNYPHSFKGIGLGPHVEEAGRRVAGRDPAQGAGQFRRP